MAKLCGSTRVSGPAGTVPAAHKANPGPDSNEIRSLLEGARRPHAVGQVDQRVAVRLGWRDPGQAPQGRLDAELQAVLGEREAEDVVGARGVVGEPVHRGAEYQGADLQ